jgi:hypothetical protein
MITIRIDSYEIKFIPNKSAVDDNGTLLDGYMTPAKLYNHGIFLLEGTVRECHDYVYSFDKIKDMSS